MTANRILYVLVCICAFLFWVMYRGALSLQLLIVCLSLPILLCLLLAWQKRKLQVSLGTTNDQAMCDERFHILMRMQSSCPIPVHYAIVTLHYTHSIAGEHDGLYVHLPGMGRSQQTLRLPFSTNCCGKVTFRGGQIRIYDPLSLFSFRLSFDDRVSLLILPQTDHLTALPALPDTATIEQSEQFSKVRAGDDPSEVFSVDPYQQGDVLSHTHWKLSAKTDDMMIKHFSLPVSEEMVVYVDYRRYGADIRCTKLLHNVISVAASVSHLLLHEEQPHIVQWYPIAKGEDEATPIVSSDALYLTFREMLSDEPFPYKNSVMSADEQFAASRMIYCTALLDDETVLRLSSMAATCRILVLYICLEENPTLPKDIDFECYPVICNCSDDTEVMQNA